jgi:DNA gyrase/topoisomerase IV subunit A
MPTIDKKTITEIIDIDYLSYAMYTLESRAIPSVIDGLKPSQRKLIYAMVNEYGGKKVKVAELGGGISKYNYNHGEVSAMTAAIGMAAPWSNNAPLLDPHGNFGSRMIQESAAPRYIYSSLSENFKKYFVDTEIAPEAFDKENPEPAYYLPIIPWVLINGVSGLSVGFKTEILPRASKDVLSATKAYLKNPKKFLEADEPLTPSFPHFRGTIVQIAPNQWKTQGIIQFIGKNRFQISELPVGYDRADYVTFLNELITKDLIKDYDDDCSKTGFGFTIKVSIAQKESIEKDPHKYFKLEKTHTEILTTMGVDGKLKIFQSVAELIGYFCDFRLTMFQKKIDFDKAELSEEILRLVHKLRFIDRVLNQQIDVSRSTKQELLDYIEKYIHAADWAKAFIRIPLYEITQDEVVRLEQTISDKKTALGELDSLTPEKLFQTRLNTIKL